MSQNNQLTLDDVSKLLSENNEQMLNKINDILDNNNNNINAQISKIYTLIDSVKAEINDVKTEINIKMEKIISENRARHYDMQNISLQNHGISLSGHVSSSQAAGRSPRIKLNSFDTYR